MADPLIDTDDLAEYWRPLTPAELTVGAALIQAASSIIRRRIPDIDAKIAAGVPDQSVVAYVVTEMVKSAVDATNRPVDAKSDSETTGPFSRSFSYAAASRLQFTDDLVSMMGGTVADVIGSARLGRPQCRPNDWHYPHVGQWR